MTSEINNIDGRTFAVASDPAKGLSSVVYRTRRSDKYVLAESSGPHFNFPQLISSELGPHREAPILPDGNIALCYNPCIDGQRIMFFLDEDEGDGYIYMRTSSSIPNKDEDIVDWNIPTRINVRGKGFKAHKKSRLAAIFHRDLHHQFIFLFCIDRNCHLVKLQGEMSPTGDQISWTSSVSPYTCAPRGDLAAVEVGAQICILYRNLDLDLYMARIPNYDPSAVSANGETNGWPRNYIPVVWKGCTTLILEASKLKRDTSFALRARTHTSPGVQEPAVDAFFVRPHENDFSRLIYCSLRIVAPLSQGDGSQSEQNGPAIRILAWKNQWDARPDSDNLPGHDIRSDSKIGINVQGEKPYIFYVDTSNGINSLKRSELPAKTPVGQHPQRPTAPITVVTNVELRDNSLVPEGTEAEAEDEAESEAEIQV